MILLPCFCIVRSVLFVFSNYYVWGRHGPECKVVGCTSTRAFNEYQINPTNINDWHSSGTIRYYHPCSSWVAPWSDIAFLIPIDICDFRSRLHHEDIPFLYHTFFGFHDELVLSRSSKTKEIDELLVLFVCLSCFSCIYIHAFFSSHIPFLVFLETYFHWHTQWDMSFGTHFPTISVPICWSNLNLNW